MIGSRFDDRAERVRRVRHRDHLRLVRDHVLEDGQVEVAGVEGGNHAQRRAGPLARHLPRDDVGVVLEGGHHDLVAGLEERREPVGDQVDGLGRAAREHDLVRVLGAEMTLDGAPGRLVVLGPVGAQEVDAAVHVGVFVRVVRRQTLENDARLLRRRRVVEVDERAPVVDGPVEDREVGPQAVDVE